MNLHKTNELKGLLDDQLSNSATNVLICCASFEERSTVLPLKLSPGQFHHVLICEHEEVEEIVRDNVNKLIKHFGKKAKKAILSLSYPLKTLDALIAAITSLQASSVITFVVDITTFTHESQLILIKLLSYLGRPQDSIKFLYASAAKYSVAKIDNSDDPKVPLETDQRPTWLSKGIREIRSVIGFPGVLLPSRKLHLIVLSGYEEERAAKIIDNYEANFVSIGLGAENESIHPELYDINVAFHQRLCGFYKNAQTFSFSLTNPVNARDNIQSQINKYPECNTVIAPLNTKISTLGAALLGLRNREIQLSYAEVNYYNIDNYSRPGDEFYLFDLPALFNAHTQGTTSTDW